MVSNPHNDIVRDILRRIQEAEATTGQPLSVDQAQSVEAEIRRAWLGERVYIAARPDRPDGAERNSRIMRAYLQNIRLKEIARKEGITVRRILQIVKR